MSNELDFLNRILNNCIHLECLVLENVYLDDWGALSMTGNALKSLAMHECNVSDEFLYHLPAQSQLKEVAFKICDQLTGRGYSFLMSHCPNIISFRLIRIKMIEWDIKCFDKLAKLELLVLSSVFFPNDSFVYFCNNMKELRLLVLFSVDIGDEVVVNVNNLPNLINFYVENCWNITTSFFAP